MAQRQPPWRAPTRAEGVELPDLVVYNSLTRTKNAFVPVNGRKVTWYACGPTVYDDAHLGHARNYVSTDIIRRTLKYYFNFDLTFVMNVTDVDDKIILRGRQQHLLADFTSKHPTLDESVLSTAKQAFEAYIKKNLTLLPPDIQLAQFDPEAKKAYKAVLEGRSLADDGTPPGDREAKIKMHLKTSATAAEALVQASSDPSSLSITDFYTQTTDVFLPYLDSLHGSEIDASDYSIFTKLTQRYEDRFTEDMQALNVLAPDVITRATEYIEKIVSMNETIVNKGSAYPTSDGSVYFDITAHEKRGLPYARLEPENRGDKALQADGEGALTQKTSEKRSDADFALWKASKPGEPSWPSPWGQGRPGWHIECSAMASDILGKTMDIHSGGVDLKFPHHDNELAQSEAYWADTACGGHSHENAQWVNYFLHMGHLSIAGSKMSKSLKNFTTIREALSRGTWTPRGLRIAFLLGNWEKGIEITDEKIKEGLAWESHVNNFFLKARDLLSNPTDSSSASPNDSDTPATNGSSDADSTLRTSLEKAKQEVDAALCNSFDTPTAMRALSTLISDYNSSNKSLLSKSTVLEAARWVTHIVTIWGLNAPGIDPSAAPDSTAIGWAGVDIPEEAKPFVIPLSRLRDDVRKRAIAAGASATIPSAALSETLAQQPHADTVQDAAAIPYAEALSQFQEDVSALAAKEAPARDYLSLCDQLRDIRLWDLGIYLEDREAQPAMIRPVDRELVAARREKEEQATAKAAAKEKREKEEAERAAKKAELAKLSHLDMFRTQEYSAWDEEGLPVRDREGREVPKSRGKKLRKEWERQRKLHEEYLAGLGKGV
ncbi:cysteinyl-tRNA synthetase [Coniosporium apollinis]|uniref:cysteine--tRNA ligase n=1 Tax=Coniosporium apollinis TaxID=61459 RepID=A0ABQ9NL19_9PEZI|nr:cysteinyl-tRNA synthetase [Coniosporium apollinis]